MKPIIFALTGSLLLAINTLHADTQDALSDKYSSRKAATGTNQEGRKQGHHKIPPEILKKFDKDGDGQLNKEEKAAAKKEMIKRFDTNNDGKLDENEKKAMREKAKGKRDEILKKFDKDGDGKLSDEEKAAAKAEFKKMRAEKHEQKQQK
jgi:Ca2+-binding EF-hand superfamily protein